MLRATGHARMVSHSRRDLKTGGPSFGANNLKFREDARGVHGTTTSCQTLSGPLPQSGSPAREARGAAAKLLPHIEWAATPGKLQVHKGTLRH